MAKGPLKPSEVRLERESRQIADDRKHYHCIDCGSPHALFYRVGLGGKRTLLYICNKQKKYWYEGTPPRECYRYVTKTMVAPFVDGLPIPEEWSPAYKQEQEKKAQREMPLIK